MKMKVSVGFLALSLCCGTLMSVAFSMAAFAGAERGVRCPSGHSTHFSNNILKCKRQTRQYANVSCPNPLYSQLEPRAGADRCNTKILPTSWGGQALNRAYIAASCGVMPGETGWRIQQDALQYNTNQQNNPLDWYLEAPSYEKILDRCTRATDVYRYPDRL